MQGADLILTDAAVYRCASGRSNENLPHRPSLGPVVAVSTCNAAAAMGCGDIADIIRPRLAADLIVLGQNLFEIGQKQISQTRAERDVLHSAKIFDATSVTDGAHRFHQTYTKKGNNNEQGRERHHRCRLHRRRGTDRHR